MLQTGELIRLLTEIVQQSLQQPRRDLSAGDLDRPFDDPFVLLAIQTRNQELAPIDHLGQAFELTALADEVGTHRQHDVDRHFLLRRRFQEQADELVGGFLLHLAGFVEAKDLFELVDDEQEVGPFAQVGLFDRFDQAEVTAAQGGQQIFAGVFLLAIVEVGLQERVGQERQRIAAGMRDGDLPRRAGLEHLAAQQLRQQSAADQRRLAAARGPHDRHEAVAAQALEQFHRLFFAAEEQVVLFLGEWSQTGKGIHRRQVRGLMHTSP